MTPYAGLSPGDNESHAFRTGTRWQAEPEATLGLKTTREEGRVNGPVNAIFVRAAVRW